MRRLFIADQRQFGYLTDTYSYCRYLTGTYDITYVCWDYGLKRIAMPGVRVVYVPRSGRKVRRWRAFVDTVLQELRSGGHDISFIVYFRGCSWLWRAAASHPMILDIRTGSVRTNALLRWFENVLLRVEATGFRNVTVISRSLMEALRLDPRKCSVIPVGANPLEIPPKSFREIHLLYVGTLLGRDIHKTVEGFDRVKSEVGADVEITYDIAGDGPEDDKARLLAAIERSEHKKAIRYHGRVPHAEILPLFERANVGVAFVPLRPWYQCQPVTKVFEYLLAGMPVIATATRENARVIHPGNGVLIEDSVEGFVTGLREVLEHRSRYESDRIKDEQRGSRWEAIVEHDLKPSLEGALSMPGRQGRQA